MSDKISLQMINGVSETLLIPLRGRYLETKRPGGVINDPKSVEIADLIDHKFSEIELPWDGQIMTSARTEILDEATEEFLRNNPDSVIVNLGCGLDTRAHRVDNGIVRWYDLDLPDCIKLRKNFFKQTDRFKFIAKSVLDFSWVDEIEKGKKTLFIAEGLFNYFNKADVKAIVMAIIDNFPDAEIIFEAYSPLVIKSWHRNPHVKKAFSMFKWGLHTGKSLEKWDDRITFIEEWSYLDRHPKRWRWIRHFRHIWPISKLMKIVHISFKIG